jgi:hypothetical protein
MAAPSRKQSVSIPALPIAILVLVLVASTIAVLTVILPKMQRPQETEETRIDTDLAITCQNACSDCSSKEYDARCFDRCRFGFKPYCD